MKRYKVTLRRTTVEFATIEVAAENYLEADSIALRQAPTWNLGWKESPNVPRETRISSTDEVKTVEKPAKKSAQRDDGPRCEEQGTCECTDGCGACEGCGRWLGDEPERIRR